MNHIAIDATRDFFNSLLELVFEMFLKFGAVAKVMRVLNERGLDLPRRDHDGDPHWARATIASVASILKNPAYAGAFVYGRCGHKMFVRYKGGRHMFAIICARMRACRHARKCAPHGSIRPWRTPS
ncbi:MAG: site-specific recombinase DNA invertase Pin [Xanthobacteraceae bacterium]|nr:MAG: site-specific recombinase DNA invertase Pin [Xanthobacteraceae bacterium]KAF0205082.1 MAG: site-specific recombinase DNA invertase [Methylocystaceae bacterium]